MSILDTYGARLYRDDPLVVITPASPGTPGGTVIEDRFVCGFYPREGIITALGVIFAAFPGIDPHSDQFYRELGARLNYDFLTQTPAMDPAFAASMRDTYYSGGGLYSTYPYGYLCAYFRVPVTQAGTPPTPAVIGHAGVPGWDGSAFSIGSLYNSGFVKFRVQGSTNALVGLQDGDPLDPNSRFEGIAILGDIFRDLRRPKAGLSPSEPLTLLTGDSQATFPLANDRPMTYTVSRRNGFVTFRADDDAGPYFEWTWQMVLNADLVPGLFKLGAVLHDPGAWVEGIEVRQYVDVALQLPAMAVRGGNGTVRNEGRVKLPRFSTSTRQRNGGAFALRPLAVLGGRAYGIGRVSLPKLKVQGSPALVPGGSLPNRGALRMPRLGIAAHGLTAVRGQSTLTLKPLKVRGGRPIAEGYLGLPPMTAYGFSFGGTRAAVYSHSAGQTSSDVDRVLALAFSSDMSTASAMVFSSWQLTRMNEILTVAATAGLGSVVELQMMSSLFNDVVSPLFLVPGDVWAMNLANDATSTYENYAFNSFGTLDGMAFGAKTNGIYVLEGSTDAGSFIRASVSFGKQDFNTKTLKNLSRAYAGVSSSGAMYLKVIVDDHEYIYVARNAAEHLTQQRFDVGRGIKSTYFTFELFNQNGSDFDLDSVSFFAADFIRRI